MKSKILLSFFLFPSILLSQPVVYINFVSHNEPNEMLQNNLYYQAMKTKVLQLASIINTKGASWNLETCDGFARGAYNNEPSPFVSNVFKTITSGIYADNIEIDPRPKVSDSSSYNIADTWKYLDTLGCFPTQTLGGFLYYSQNPPVQGIDWWRYQDTITGITFPWIKWKAKLMWGAGSYQPHTNDLNDYGIWKPHAPSNTNTLDSFYIHDPNKTVWYIGNGCQPINSLDSAKNINDILNPLRDFIDSIQTGLLPQNKFYVYSVTINQREFGNTLFQKISQLCDTINNWGTSKIQWKKLTEKFTLFETWQTNTGLQYSQWNCGDVPNAIEENEKNEMYIYPNPADQFLVFDSHDQNFHEVKLYNLFGQLLSVERYTGRMEIDISHLPPGVYVAEVDGAVSRKIIKK